MFAFRFGGGVPDEDQVMHFFPSNPQGGVSKGVLPFGHSILSLSSTTHGFSWKVLNVMFPTLSAKGGEPHQRREENKQKITWIEQTNRDPLRNDFRQCFVSKHQFNQLSTIYLPASDDSLHEVNKYYKAVHWIEYTCIWPATVAQRSNSVETRFSFVSFSPRSRSKTNVKRLTSSLRCKSLTTSTHQPNVVAKYELNKNVAPKTKESVIQEGALTISFGSWTVPAHFKDVKVLNVSSSILIYEHLCSRLACVKKQKWYLLK